MCHCLQAALGRTTASMAAQSMPAGGWAEIPRDVLERIFQTLPVRARVWLSRIRNQREPCSNGLACQASTASVLADSVVSQQTDARVSVLQDASDAINAGMVCRSWRAAGEQLRHPRLTVYTDNNEQTLRTAEGLRTGIRVRRKSRVDVCGCLPTERARLDASTPFSLQLQHMMPVLVKHVGCCRGARQALPLCSRLPLLIWWLRSRCYGQFRIRTCWRA